MSYFILECTGSLELSSAYHIYVININAEDMRKKKRNRNVQRISARDPGTRKWLRFEIVTFSGSLEYVPKDRVRLRYGRIEKIPIGHSGSRNLSNEERVVPISYLGGNHWKTNKPLNFTTAILPKRNSRDTLSHRGNFLHFVA